MVQPTRKQETQATTPQQKEKVYKRTTKKMPQQQKEKIRQSLKRFNQANPRSSEWCQKISKGCKAYWDALGEKDETKIEDLI